MRRPVQQRVRIGLAGVGSLAASVALAFVAQHPRGQPALAAALVPVLAIAAYVGGMTAASAAAFVLRLRGVGLVAVGWVLALAVTRLLVEPGVALEGVGHLPPELMETWAAASNAGLWFAAVPLDVVFGAASCGGVIAVLAAGAQADAPEPSALRLGLKS